MRLGVVAVSAASTLACASSPPPPSRGLAPVDIPRELVAAIARGEQLGRVIYEQYIETGRSVDPVREVAARRARESAKAVSRVRCSDEERWVVIRNSDARGGWLVYALGNPARPGYVVVGGHHRFVVSEDGVSVLESTPMFSGCFETPPPETPPSGVESAVVVRHTVSDWPFETYAFLSRLHWFPFYVETRIGLWRAHEGWLTYYGREQPPPGLRPRVE